MITSDDLTGKVWDIIVVGGGPIGSYSTFRLSRMGYEVIQIEDHPEPGKPLQCAGLVNNRVFDMPGLSKIRNGSVLHDIFGADVHSPGGHMLPLGGRDIKAVAIDRSEFDRSLFSLAAENAAEVLMGQKVTGGGRNGGHSILNTYGHHGKMNLKGRMIIGCDGGASSVRRIFDLPPPKEMVPGVNGEFTLRKGRGPTDRVGVFTGSSIAPGFFAWAIPSGDDSTFRLGLSTTKSSDLLPFFQNFLNSDHLRKWFGAPDGGDYLSSISLSFGNLPMGMPDRISKPGVLLLGDSAGMAKPTSGGGIYPGLLAVDELCRIIDDRGALTDEIPGLFDTSFRKGYGRELERSLLLRKLVQDVRDREIDKVLSRLKDDDVVEIINEKGDIDRPFELALELLRAKPSLVYLIPRFLPYTMKILKLL